jgi:hypothetical protein
MMMALVRLLLKQLAAMLMMRHLTGIEGMSAGGSGGGSWQETYTAHPASAACR